MTIDTDISPVPGDDQAEPRPRGQRSLSEKILVAFHHACDSRDVEAAERLLQSANASLTGNTKMSPSRLRWAREGIVAAHERLWLLKQPKVALRG